MKPFNILTICYIFFIFYLLVEQRKKINKIDYFKNNIEKFNFDDNIDTQTINNLLSIMNSNFLYISGLNVDNLVINGKLIVNNGSDFNGGLHFFSDESNVGTVAIGNVLGNPGISSTGDKQLAIGSGTGNVYVHNNLKVDTYYLRQKPKTDPKYDVELIRAQEQAKLAAKVQADAQAAANEIILAKAIRSKTKAGP